MSILHRPIVVLLLSVSVGGCGGSAGQGDGTSGDDGSGTSGPPSTRELDAATLEALTSVSTDRSVFEFHSRTSQLNQFQRGDLLVAGVHPPTLPYGALRRVENVDRSGESVTVTTSPVSLAEAVDSGQIHTRIPLSSEDLNAAPKMGPFQLGPGQLVFAIEKTVLFDGDNDESTTHDQVTIEGNMTMEPEVVIDIEINNFTLDAATIAVEGDVIADLTIEADREATIPLFDKTLHTQPFPEVVIPMGPIPVVFVPILEIHAGAEGKVSAAMTAHLNYEADGRVGFGYDGGFGAILQVDPSGSADVPEFLDSAQASAKVWLSAKFKVSVYGLAGAFVESRFFGEALVDVEACPWWELYVGAEGLAGAFAEINVALFDVFGFSGTIFDWHTDPLSTKAVVADAGACVPSTAPGDIVTWAKSYGAEGIDYPVGIAVLADGGAVVAGSTSSFTSQNDATLMKIDSVGRIAWQISYDDLDAGIATIPVDDGYYLLAGEHTVSAFLTPPFLPEGELETAVDPPAYLLRLDANGGPLWAVAIASAEQALDAAGLALLPDGSIVVAGTMGDPPDGEDVWIAEFDSEGTLLWSRRIDEPGTQETQSLIVDSAGDVVVLASAGVMCDLLFKFNADGEALWQACYGSSHNNFAAQVVESAGGYSLIGHLGNDGQINHVDRDGNLLWARHLDSDVHEFIEMPDGSRVEAPDETPYDETYAAAVFSDGDLLVTGKVDLGEDSDLWALRLDSQGQPQWFRRYGGGREDVGGGWLEFSRVASTVAVTPDGGALIAGYSTSFSHAADATSFDIDTWILKIRGSGTVDLDANSGASAGAVSGEVYEVDHYGTPEVTVPAVSVELIVVSFAPVVYSPELETSLQGGPE